MSEHEKRGPRRVPANLDELVDEARGALKPDAMGSKVDWEKVDAELFSRIETQTKSAAGSETSGVRKSGLSSPNQFGWRKGSEPKRAWQIGGMLAAAAAIALMLHRPATTAETSFDSSAGSNMNGSNMNAAQARSDSALIFTASQTGGDVRVNGEVASAGRSLRPLDAIETTTTHADFSSLGEPAGEPAGEPGGASTQNSDSLRAAWRLEDHSHVTVRSLGGGGSPLILEIAAGTIEAQVTPVERGEAFAIDLRNPDLNGAHDVIRIAVHGTHLRVTRDPAKNTASIDLSEGVVSIGFPPKSGSTYGQLVTAPAHVEIDLTKMFSSASGDTTNDAVTVDKNPTAVRAPEGLWQGASQDTHDTTATQTAAQNPETTATDPDETHVATNEVRPQPTTHVAQLVDPHPEETIRAAARACAAVRESSNEVRVSVSSKLTLQVGEDGAVRMARFEPPLTPEAQECAGKTIYKTRFAPAATEHAIEIPVRVDPATDP